jgi:hypothetical protein
MTLITIGIEIDDYEDDDIDMDKVRGWITGEIDAMVDSLRADTDTGVKWEYVE